MQDKDTIKILVDLYGDHILPVEKLPHAFCPGGVVNVKAIYLGCDPSNVHSAELPYVFAHECELGIFNSFIKAHTEQLAQIGLSWETVYTQNLCRNYFKKETSKNKIWKTVATEFWIDKLIEELSKFDSTIPVLLTSQLLLEVLCVGGYENIPAMDFYEGRTFIPVPPEKNKLKRELIPVYRGRNPKMRVSYHLKNNKWTAYRNSIIDYFTKKVVKNISEKGKR